ncbi:MAG: MaoC/PaaZ C-terminal domain-containing protein [Minwuia sp.]|uniref:MaoC/PaaZ C-terminal domain-containing protein n=1 Tax=Minwuia sp. TaxID=2493630 RepID=UPI003A8802AF
MALKASDAKVGDSREVKLVEDLKRTQLVMYSGASGDYNPLHSDDKYTKEAAGYPGVFAHGMLTMGMTGRAVTDWVGVTNVKKYGVRFTNQVWPGDTLTATATIADIREEDGETVAEIKVETKNQDGATVITGAAVAKLAG